jgi:chemotaxis protein CheX
MTQAAVASPPPSSLDPKLILPLVNSIRAVFSTMVKLDVTINRPNVKTTPAPTYDVSGIIGLSGDLIGSIVVSFQLEAAAKIVSLFAGTPLSPQSPDFPDAVGELANMIAGGAKKAFGGMANITVPNVIIGSGHTIARLSDVPCLVIPCQTQSGNFAVEVSIKKVGSPDGNGNRTGGAQ